MAIQQKYRLVHAVRLNDGKIELQAEVLCTFCSDHLFIPTQKFLVDPGEIVRFNETKIFCACGRGFVPKIPQKTGAEFLKDFHREFKHCEEVFGKNELLKPDMAMFFCGSGKFVPVDAEALECFREETRKADGLRKKKKSDPVGEQKKISFKKRFIDIEFESK